MGDHFEASGHLDDMTALPELSENSILKNLQARYAKEIIYTYTGTILVACNPYKWISIYEDEYVKKYSQAKFGELPPHIFAIAEASFSHMKSNHENQSVIISGESGAGKTESTKLILQYLTAVTTNQMWIEQQIMEASTILESFGNAKTVRNNNSSRFGKFMQVQFDKEKRICGASIVNYLLEKSRVSGQAPEERNYHCFYQLVLGATDEEKTKYKLPAPEQFSYLNKSGSIKVATIDDKKDYEALKLALTVMNLTPEDIDRLFRLLAAILHIGNINFAADDQDNSKVSNPDTVKIISELLECDGAKLAEAFIFRSIVVRGEMSKIPLNVTAAKDSRDSVAKALYSRLFDWIVDYINVSIKPTEKTQNFIGVLDIFGFELFKVNSFEQLCINYANEKLQQFFTNYIFKLEQTEYEKEGINWAKIDFVDNAECIDLLENKLGIFALLDEETRFPKATDETYLAKINEKYEKHKYYVKPRQATANFGIRHYAGEVSYEIKDFLDKNKDEASELMFAALGTSPLPLIKALVEVKADEEEKGAKTMKKKLTVAGNFRQQLMSLVTILGTTNPQYVRCIKPNSTKSSFQFEEELVLAQLRYSGMLETIRIRKAGYSVRVPYEQFLDKFKMLLSTLEGSTPKDKTIFLLTKLNIDNKHWQAGTTKIFMRNSVFLPLQDAKEKLLREKAIAISKVVVSNYYRQIFMRKRKAMVIIQKYVRMFLKKNRYNKMKQGAVVIQSVIRGWFARDFARMLRQQKKEAEERAKREAEEAEERRRIEESAKKSREAAEAAAQEEKKRKERDESERLKKLQEEQEILELTRQAQQVKVKMAKADAKVGVDDLGDMFSFLDVVDDEFVSKDDKSHALDRMMQDLTSQIDEIYNVEADDYKKTINKKKKSQTDLSGGAKGSIPEAPPLPSTDIYSNIRKRNEKPPAAMKSNPLQKKMEQEAAAAAAQKGPEVLKDDGDDSLETFAAKHFEEHEKVSGTIGTLKKRKKYTVKEMLSYTKHSIPTSMLKFNVPDDPRKEKMITVAVEIFREILKITDPLAKKEENIVPMIQNVVKLGIGVPELRDEILVQLVRQTTESAKDVKNWDTICIRGWQMILICLSSFPPSKGFAKCLRGYLKRSASMDPNSAEEEKEKEKDEEDSGPAEELSAPERQKRRVQLRTDVVKYAKLCEDAFQQIILNGARKLPPSAIEIDAMKNTRPIICRFYFLDGNVKAIGISSATSAAQAIKDLAKRIDLPDTAGWSIYEVYPDSEYVVKGTDVIADILARWELEKRNSATETKYQTMKKGAPAQAAVGGGEARFFLKKRLFRTPQKIPTDPVEYHLIYAQAVASVLHGDYPLNEQAALRLAALKCQVDWGDFDPEQKSRLNELHNYLTPRFAGIKPKEEYITEICAVHAKLAGKSLLQSKVLYLEAVKQFPLYGASLYAATYKGFWAHSNHLLIAVHVEGLAWVHPKTKAIMKSYKYDQVDSWEIDVGTVAFNIKADEENNESEGTRLEFECKQNEEIVNLIKDYSPAHRVGKTKQEKVAEISAEEVSGLAGDIEKARNRLLETRTLRLPGPAAANPTGTTKFKTMSLMKNTLKGTLTKDKKRQSSSPGPDSPSSAGYEYTLADWSFSKTRLSFSLLDMDLTLDAELHENSLRMNTCLLAYAGLAQAPPFPEDDNPRAPMALMVQDVIRGCLEVPRARDELYLQLIKLTTSHPEPDSAAVIKLWRFLCIACWIFLPSQLVLEYLRAHLRSYAYGNAPTLSRRKKEREHARYALKALQRTQTNAGRKQPPSAEEISFVINMKPMFARFHFMDGQSRALTFDPATTTTEVLDMVKDKIGVKNCTGFSLFESFGSLERSMTGKEKVADTIFKWDKFAKQTNSDKTLKLIFKRRIFMPPLDQFSNETERDLVMHQAIYDVANDRYPVTEEESAYLAGLRAQIELGDTATYKAEDSVYADNVKKYLPKHYVKAGAPALVAAAHAKLKGKNKDECKKLYMDHILSWELYGSTIFNVLQSYTSAMPNNLWLAVNHTGVHILNRRSKTPLLSYTYKSIVNYSPSHKNIMIMTESLTRGTKYVFNTSEASQIAHLIKDYTDVIIANRKKEAGAAKTAKPAGKK